MAYSQTNMPDRPPYFEEDRTWAEQIPEINQTFATLWARLNELIAEFSRLDTNTESIGSGYNTHDHSPADPTQVDHAHLLNILGSGAHHFSNAQHTELVGVAALVAVGIVSRTAAATYIARTITGTVNQVNVANGNGVAGNPLLSLPQDIHTGANPTFATLTTTGGRINSTTRITSADSPYAVLATDEIIFVDTDSGAVTVNLPAGVDGTHYRIINCGTSGNAITVNPNGAELLLGVNSSYTLLDGQVMELNYETTEGWY